MFRSVLLQFKVLGAAIQRSILFSHHSLPIHTNLHPAGGEESYPLLQPAMILQ
jgi:hypothetical protein